MAFLLDVNVLVALLWTTHEDHLRVQQWFVRNSPKGWATCAFTQAAFVRISANPAIFPNAVRPSEAIEMLNKDLLHPSHQFWKDEISFAEAVKPFRERLSGHRQVTDAYLLGLAIHMKGKLATMDRAVLGLLLEKDREHGSVTLI
ncbi:MAG TPA: TA system VapC family ribonuclease toxin [Candidatus Angelobacter sp.]|jgi:toxin-antitoxin system PIN domain toxin|nr:TA system VapC family ribonuclease toxin [Candidatus Angelobacter sp.]